MPDTKSELNDIILNKTGSSFSGFKKLLLAVASFAVLLIIVVVVMSSINDNSKGDLAKTILPPEPNMTTDAKSELFKSVDIAQENGDDEQKRLESIANEIKQQTLPAVVAPQEPESVPTKEDERITIEDPYTEAPVVPVEKEPKKAEPVKVKPKTAKAPSSHTKKGNWYVQVGSFVRANPHERLLAKIKRLGFASKQYKSTINGQKVTKLLIGPYETSKEARIAKTKIAAEIEPAAFIYQVIQ